MEHAIVHIKPTVMSTSGSGFPKNNSLRPDKPGGGLPAQRFPRLIPKGEEAVGDELKLKLGASIAERPLAPPTPEGYPVPQIDSTRTHALMQTLKELRELRDGYLRQDGGSSAGLLLAQITLVFERIQQGVPSGRETFTAALRAAQFTEPIHEAVEA